MHKTSVIFICCGNTCRSVLAERLTRRRFGDAVYALSAGISPQGPEDAKNARDTLKLHFGVDASEHVPRNVHDVDLGAYDYVVAMDRFIAKRLTGVPKAKLIVWKIDDPFGNGLEQYRRCALNIMPHVARLPIRVDPIPEPTQDST